MILSSIFRLYTLANAAWREINNMNGMEIHSEHFDC